MDISKLDINHIELFGLAYSVARDVFDVEPIRATEKNQRRIRKWVNKTYLDDNDLPKKILAFIDDSKTDSEFIEFLAECSKHIEEHGSWKKQLFEKVAIDFSEDVRKASDFLKNTWHLMRNQYKIIQIEKIPRSESGKILYAEIFSSVENTV